MTALHDILFQSPSAGTDRIALVHRRQTKTYAQFECDVRAVARGLTHLAIGRQQRVAIFLDKQSETATTILGTAAAGLVSVPINPVLRGQQVAYILRDCNARVLVTTRTRLGALESELADCPDLRQVYLVDDDGRAAHISGVNVAPFRDLMLPQTEQLETAITVGPSDMAGILYTSGSTGNPKGVVFSHRNLVVGAQSVSQYLKYRVSDRIINIPPYSFDFGLNQLFSTLCVGATAVLHNFVTAEDLMKTIVEAKVTGVSGVPTVMIQLTQLPWPEEAASTVRYLSTTGGRMPEPAVRALRRALPGAEIYLMYGLTEAFRSTYLPPEEVDRRPNSIGKAIPNAEVLVVRPDGTICDPEEEGELVHKGPLITLGYWNDPVRTAERFRPAPGEPAGKRNPEIAVWSGDTVKRDVDGFIYYVGRRDEMIKTSGYRVSPTEVEEAVFASGEVAVAAAVGVADDLLGQTIVVYVTPKPGRKLDVRAILSHCRKVLPAYMVPQHVIRRDEMPLNPNGKIDRKQLAHEHAEKTMPQAPAEAGVALTRPESFLTRWRNALLEIFGLRSRKFASVAEVYRWALPDTRPSPDDSFISLGGDSLSYVNLSVALNNHLGRVPENWAEQSIGDLERRDRENARSVSVAPDILLRVIAMIDVVASHTRHFADCPLLWGAAKIMLLISGLSFVRFSWSGDPRRTLRAAGRFFSAILIPTTILFAVTFALEKKINWPILFFVDNFVSPVVPTWWPGAWFIQNLMQFIVLSLALAFVPAVRRFSIKHSFVFASILLAVGVAAYVDFVAVHPAKYGEFTFLPWGYFWLFALGWLFAVSTQKSSKIAAFGLLIVAVAVVFTANNLYPSNMSRHMYSDGYCIWLVAGGVYLLWGRSIAVPKVLNTIIIVLARSMLFVFLFHWPLAIAIETVLPSFSMTILLGTASSIVIWIFWESLWAAIRSREGSANISGADRAFTGPNPDGEIMRERDTVFGSAPELLADPLARCAQTSGRVTRRPTYKKALVSQER